MYGGTDNPMDDYLWVHGLSPRVRGNPAEAVIRPVELGSIPACTGEPGANSGELHYGGTSGQVYPRVYGGTSTESTPPLASCGLSPRVRGNLDSFLPSMTNPGSIPACTGEPTIEEAVIALNKVYPRVYGGTNEVFLNKSVAPGLSPRVRGNLY